MDVGGDFLVFDIRPIIPTQHYNRLRVEIEIDALRIAKTPKRCAS